MNTEKTIKLLERNTQGIHRFGGPDNPLVLRKIIIVLLLALFIAGCKPRTGSAEFPVGLFDCVECQNFTMRFSEDGSLVVYMRDIKYITGKWFVEDDIFYTGDSFCNDTEVMSASYKWRFDGEILTLKLIEDECSDRVSSLNEKPWKLVEEKEE